MGFENDKVKYSDSWILPNGLIFISINSSSFTSASIVIVYEDNINAKILEENIIDEI